MRFTRSRKRLFAAVVGPGLAASAAATPAVAGAPSRRGAPGAAAADAAVDSRSTGRAVRHRLYTDEATGKEVVTADSTVPASALSKLTRTVGADADAIMTSARGRVQALHRRGDAIHGSGVRCSVGFNVRSGGTDYFLTAAECARRGGDVVHELRSDHPDRTDGETEFPGNDYALVRHDNTSLTYEAGYSVGDVRVGHGHRR